MRNSLLTPIPELELAAKLLDAAADALLANRVEMARILVTQANFPEITEYAKRLVGKMSIEVHRSTRRPKGLTKDQRDPTRMPSPHEQDAIFLRDGWRCRFCGVKVVNKSARSVIAGALKIGNKWTSVNSQQHSGLYALASSLDHILPHSQGGKNHPSNFVTACYCCQFGRGEWTLDEVELLDPTGRQPIRDSWDGLSRLATVQPNNSFKPKPLRGSA